MASKPPSTDDKPEYCVSTELMRHQQAIKLVRQLNQRDPRQRDGAHPTRTRGQHLTFVRLNHWLPIRFGQAAGAGADSRGNEPAPDGGREPRRRASGGSRGRSPVTSGREEPGSGCGEADRGGKSQRTAINTDATQVTTSIHHPLPAHPIPACISDGNEVSEEGVQTVIHIPRPIMGCRARAEQQNFGGAEVGGQHCHAPDGAVINAPNDAAT
ncbi:hypothetical protein C8F04DRAFT_1177225 [Mycena alexandri]|uniref:Uncharacterized protein n=1 Tax=Mycena alexandri TaxID=1745969 RepID=A0AAD6T7S2_9AGAR|nr:hypothetical protein C8F04DRAFT_1177225 [Mycena alexandri]